MRNDIYHMVNVTAIFAIFPPLPDYKVVVEVPGVPAILAGRLRKQIRQDKCSSLLYHQETARIQPIIQCLKTENREVWKNIPIKLRIL